MRILVVEGDPVTAQSIDMMLKAESFKVTCTAEGEEAVELAKLYDFDAITLELCLPDVSGFDVLRRIRAARVRTPAIVLSGLADLDSKVKALGVGADDYVTKPFHRDELVARLHALVRRSAGHASSLIQVNDLSVNITSRTASIGGHELHLTGKEWSVLELLAMRKGSCVTKDQILSHLYGGMDEPEIKIVDVFVCKLRKKLAQHSGGRRYIETVWGRGHMMRDEVTECPSLVPEIAEMTGGSYAHTATDNKGGMVQRRGSAQ